MRKWLQPNCRVAAVDGLAMAHYFPVRPKLFGQAAEIGITAGGNLIESACAMKTDLDEELPIRRKYG